METNSPNEGGTLSLEQQLSSLIRRMVMEGLAEMQATAGSANAERPVAAPAQAQATNGSDDRIAEYQAALAAKDAEIARLKEQLEQAKAAPAATAAASTPNLLWNEVLSLPELANYAAEWKANLQSDSPDPVLVCMVTNLAVWQATHAYKLTLEDNQDTSYDNSASRALYNFSRYFFKALYAQDTDYGKAADLAEVMANYLNDKLRQDNAPYRIELTELGNTYSSRNMEISPDGESTGCVDALCSWAITNAAGNIYKDKILVRLI